MTGDKSNAGLALPQTKKLIEQLSQLEDRHHNLLACYRFYDQAIRAMTQPEELEDSDQWYLGLFLNQQWLRQQGELLLQELTRVKQSLNT